MIYFAVNFFITGRNEVLAKVIFLHLCVIHSVHRGGVPDQAPPPPPMDQTHPWTRHPPDQTPPGTDIPPGTDTPTGADPTPPGTRHPPPDQTPPGTRSHPGEADTRIRSTIGQYASYWNAFLLQKVL